MLLCLSLYSEKNRLVYSAITILLSVNLILTFSFDTLLITCAVCFFILIHWGIKVKLLKPLLISFSIACLAIVFSFALIGPGLPQPYFKSPVALGKHLISKVNGRSVIFQRAASIIEERPILGVGPGQFKNYFPKYRPPTAKQYAFLHLNINHAHNDYLQQAAESGLVGLAIFLCFWLTILFLPPRNCPKELELAYRAGLTSLLLVGIFDSNLNQIPATSFLAYVAAGLLHAKG